MILEFDVPESHLAIALAHLGTPTKAVPKNQGQLEVTVAPGILHVTEGPFKHMGRLLYKAVLKPLPDSNRQQLFDEALRLREAEARKVVTLDEAEILKTFGSENAKQIIALRSQLPLEGKKTDVAASSRTFTTKDGRWVLDSWDELFGYNFELHKL